MRERFSCDDRLADFEESEPVLEMVENRLTLEVRLRLRPFKGGSGASTVK